MGAGSLTFLKLGSSTNLRLSDLFIQNLVNPSLQCTQLPKLPTPPPSSYQSLAKRQLHEAQCPINKSVRKRSLPFMLYASFPTSTEILSSSNHTCVVVGTQGL